MWVFWTGSRLSKPKNRQGAYFWHLLVRSCMEFSLACGRTAVLRTTPAPLTPTENLVGSIGRRALVGRWRAPAVNETRGG